MILLSIECSHSEGSVSIQNNGSILATSLWKQEKSHAELLHTHIDVILKKSGLSFAGLDAFGVTLGPGSFTGIRIAINTIKTFAYVLDKKVYAATTLDIIAHQQKVETKQLLVAIDAHSELYYLQRFSNKNHFWVPDKEIEVIKVSNFNELLKIPDCTFAVNVRPSAPALGDFVFKNISKLTPFYWNNLEPLYIRQSAPEEKAALK